MAEHPTREYRPRNPERSRIEAIYPSKDQEKPGIFVKGENQRWSGADPEAVFDGLNELLYDFYNRKGPDGTPLVMGSHEFNGLRGEGPPESYTFSVFYEENVERHRKFGHVWIKHIGSEDVRRFVKEWDFPHAPFEGHYENFIVYFNVYSDQRNESKWTKAKRNVEERDAFLETLVRRE